VGSTVVTTESANLRIRPSREAEVVVELSQGTQATVTGEVEEAEGLRWVPVRVTTPDGELQGYVAVDFVDSADPAIYGSRNDYSLVIRRELKRQ
jgi:hypothetical protein